MTNFTYTHVIVLCKVESENKRELFFYTLITSLWRRLGNNTGIMRGDKNYWKYIAVK